MHALQVFPRLGGGSVRIRRGAACLCRLNSQLGSGFSNQPMWKNITVYTNWDKIFPPERVWGKIGSSTTPFRWFPQGVLPRFHRNSHPPGGLCSKGKWSTGWGLPSEVGSWISKNPKTWRNFFGRFFGKSRNKDTLKLYCWWQPEIWRKLTSWGWYC